MLEELKTYMDEKEEMVAKLEDQMTQSLIGQVKVGGLYPKGAVKLWKCLSRGV